MSEPLRVGFVFEGPTDFSMLSAVIERVLRGRDFIPHAIQPEISDTFELGSTEYGTGWPGVCRWCLEMADEAGGHARDSEVFRNYDLLIVQLDADVAREQYSNGHIQDPFPDHPTLPCEEPCPPPRATTDRLRKVMLRWLGEENCPQRLILCTPSKALETWILVGLFPKNQTARSRNLECRNRPQSCLPRKPEARRLISGDNKLPEKYRDLAAEFGANWDRVARRCSEAGRFDHEFRVGLEQIV
jgi:hypothetical protein